MGEDCSLSLIPSGSSYWTSCPDGHRTSAGCCRKRRFFSSPIKKHPAGCLIFMADGRDCSLSLIPLGSSCRTSCPDGHRTSAGCCRKRRFFSSPIKKNPAGCLIFMADGRGFEPPLGFRPKHTFQACAFNHSATHPKVTYLYIKFPQLASKK